MARRALSLLPSLLILLAVSLPVLLYRSHLGRGYYDQANYHWRVVTKFAAELPRPDLTDYASATTPLYHLVLAVMYRTVTQEVVYHQLVGTVVSIVLLTVVWWFVHRAASPALTATLLLPIACSIYVLDSAIWVLPDNAGWTWVALVLGITFRAPLTARSLALCGLAMALLVLTRQSHLWCAAAIWAGAWLSVHPGGAGAGPRNIWGLPLDQLGARAALTAAGFAATLPALAIAGWFYWLWGGRLAPPVFDIWYTRYNNPSAVAFILSLTAIYSVFYSGYLVPRLLPVLKTVWPVLLIAALVGAAVGSLPHTDYDLEQGRYGGIWSIAKRLPVYEHRSPFIAALSTAGAVAVICWAIILDWRRRWLFLGCMAAFLAAQSVNPWVYQRYAEPFLLMLMTFSAASLPADSTQAGAARTSRLWVAAQYAGPCLLGALLLSVAVRTYLTAEPPVILPPGQIDQPPKNPSPNPGS